MHNFNFYSLSTWGINIKKFNTCKRISSTYSLDFRLFWISLRNRNSSLQNVTKVNGVKEILFKTGERVNFFSLSFPTNIIFWDWFDINSLQGPISSEPVHYLVLLQPRIIFASHPGGYKLTGQTDRPNIDVRHHVDRRTLTDHIYW